MKLSSRLRGALRSVPSVDWRSLLSPVPITLWYILFFVVIPQIPASLRPDIDVKTLPTADNALLGGFGFLHQLCGRVANTFFDVIMALPYTLHYFVPVFSLLFLYVKDRSKIPKYVFTLGMINLVGVLTQVLFPTAPPWYFERYGMQPANYQIRGEPGRLQEVDNTFNVDFYYKTYSYNNPIVFGSFPSLHAAWPFLIAIFTPSPGRWMWMYVVWVCVSSLYLVHHYVIDVLGGLLYTWFFLWLAGLVFDPPPRRKEKVRVEFAREMVEVEEQEAEEGEDRVI